MEQENCKTTLEQIIEKEMLLDEANREYLKIDNATMPPKNSRWIQDRIKNQVRCKNKEEQIKRDLIQEESTFIELLTKCPEEIFEKYRDDCLSKLNAVSSENTNKQENLEELDYKMDLIEQARYTRYNSKLNYKSSNL